MRKKILCIFQQPIFHEELLQFALACASFEYQTHLLFIDDGVLQLLQPQNLIPLDREILSLYDIETLWVDALSLEKRAIEFGSLPEVSFLKGDALKAFYQQQDVIFSF